MSARIVRTVVLLALTLALVGCSSSSGIKIDAPSTPTPSVGPTPAPMGTRARSGDWSIVINRSRRMGTVSGVSAGKGNQMLVLDFEIHNGSTLSGDVNLTSFVLNDEARAEIRSVRLPSSHFVSNNPIAVPGGTTRRFTIVYRISKGGGPFVWRFWPSVQSAQPKPAVLAVR